MKFRAQLQKKKKNKKDKNKHKNPKIRKYSNDQYELDSAINNRN